jgi:hypothetical protein
MRLGWAHGTEVWVWEGVQTFAAQAATMISKGQLQDTLRHSVLVSFMDVLVTVAQGSPAPLREGYRVPLFEPREK